MRWSWEGDTLIVEGETIAVASIARLREGKRWFGYPGFVATIALAVFIGFRFDSWWGLPAAVVALVLLWRILDAMRPFLLYLTLGDDRVIKVAGTMQSIDGLRDAIVERKGDASAVSIDRAAVPPLPEEASSRSGKRSILRSSLTMSRVEAAELFDGPVELVYDFLLFLTLRAQPRPHLRTYGRMEDAEVERALRTSTSPVVIEWQYPVRFVLADVMWPAIVRNDFRLTPVETMTGVNWGFALLPTPGLLGRLLTWWPRRQLARPTALRNQHFATLLRFKHEFEAREHTGIQHSFDHFRQQLG